MDTGLAGSVTERPEPLQVTGLPGRDAFANAFVFFVEMLRTPGEAGGHPVFVLLEQLFRDIAQESLLHYLDGDAGEGLEIPGSRLTFGNTEVVVAVHQVASKSAEEDTDLERRHLGIAGDKPVVIALAVEHQEMVFLAQGDTGLVEETVVEADVLPFCFGGDLHHLEGLDLEVVGLGEGHHVGDKDGRAGAESADGQGALDDAFDAPLKGKSFLEGKLGATGIITPVALLDEGGDQD